MADITPCPVTPFTLTPHRSLFTSSLSVWSSLLALAADFTRTLHVPQLQSLSHNWLRVQHIRLFILNTCRSFLPHQSLLRALLLQPVETLGFSGANGSVEENGATGAQDAKVYLLQKVITASTLPSPVKAAYKRAELEVSYWNMLTLT